MAAVRARRPGRAAAPTRPKPPAPIPRLARIKLDGRAALAEAKSEKGLMVAAGMVLALGVTAAMAAFVGGSLLDAREAMDRAADELASGAGFTVTEIAVDGVDGARADEVRALVLPDGRRSMLAADPEAVRARLERLEWVGEARVARLWPGEVRVAVTRREAFALWQNRGRVVVVDADGRPVPGAAPQDNLHLPHLVGPGAPEAAGPVLRALEELPAVRERVAALVRVGERRWDLRLKAGLTVNLPEQDPIGALARVERLQLDRRLLDRPLTRIDLRLPGGLTVTPRRAGPVAPAPIGA